MKIHQTMWIQWPFFSIKNLSQRSLTPRWTLTPRLLRSHVWLFPKDHCVQVPWKYIKVCGYSDPFFKKTWTKGHWPLDDLWPHVCWGHMCDSTKGSLFPSPMGIHQCIWIQWSILQNTTYYMYMYTHTTHILRTEWVITSGGTQIWVGQGCAARASKPIPIFKGDFGQKGYPFLGFSFKNRPIFQKFHDFQDFFAWRKTLKIM